MKRIAKTISVFDFFRRFPNEEVARGFYRVAVPLQFLDRVQSLFPIPIDYVLSDNGSEFKKHFDKACQEKGITHWHTYPRCPKMNAHCERFNRTIQEEFIFYHEEKLQEVDTFNHSDWDWERPHHALISTKLKSPLMKIKEYFHKKRPESNLGWDHTRRYFCSKISHL